MSLYDTPQGVMMYSGLRDLKRNNNSLVDTIERANAEVRKGNAVIDSQQAEIARLRDALDMRTKEVSEFRTRAIVELAGKEGMTAMFQSMKLAHPTSPMLADSGKRYKDGDIKTRARMHYETAFDRIITNHQIGKPLEYRVN